jgi:hypothetical protein
MSLALTFAPNLIRAWTFLINPERAAKWRGVDLKASRLRGLMPNIEQNKKIE